MDNIEKNGRTVSRNGKRKVIMKYSYFDSRENRFFPFMKMPKELFSREEFKKLSSDAKLLYMFMLDRMQLSEQNEMFKDEGKVFIYMTIDEIMKTMNWTKYWTLKVMEELDSKRGIGLIQRERTGCNKPNKIYVMDFRCSGNQEAESV